MLRLSKFFSKFALSSFLIALQVLSFSCSALFGSGDEDSGKISITRLLPESDSSGPAYYKITDIKSWKAELANSKNGGLYFLPATKTGDKDGYLSSAGIILETLTADSLEAGNYKIKVYGYDAAGTQIAFSSYEADENLSVYLGGGETEDVTATLDWGASTGNELKVTFFDVDIFKVLEELYEENPVLDRDYTSAIKKTVTVPKGGVIPGEKIPVSRWFNLKCYKDSSCTVEFDLETTAVDYSMTLWSKWELIENPEIEDDERIVRFESLGGKAVDYQVVKSGETITKPDNPARKGYDFCGWYTSDGEDGEEFDFDTPITESFTLYAKWQAITYQIVYELDGGENGENPESYTVEDELTFTEPSRNGYHFEGWYISSDDGETYTDRITGISKGSTGDLMLWAVWTEFLDFYVSESGSDESGDGRESAPFATVAKAVSEINEIAENSKSYTIWISGAVSENVSLESVSAYSLAISGKTTSDSGRDILSGGGTVLSVNTSVPVTLKNLKFSGGEISVGKGSLYLSGFVSVSDDIALSSGCTVEISDSLSLESPKISVKPELYSLETRILSGAATLNALENFELAKDSDGNTWTIASDGTIYLTQIYVSGTASSLAAGDDTKGNGTQSYPYLTLSRALSDVRKPEEYEIIISGSVGESGEGLVKILSSCVSTNLTVRGQNGNSRDGISGGITVNSQQPVNFKNLFIKNSSSRGIVADGKGKLTLENLVLENNYYEGLRISGNCDVEIKSSAIDGNKGGIIKIGSGSLSVSDTSITNNETEGYGGAVYVSGGRLNISGSEISGNTAYYGGALYTYGTNTVEIVDTKISGNTALYGGGAIRLGGYDRVLISGGEISGNKAKGLTHGAGAIHVGGGSSLTLSDVLIQNNEEAAGKGGAIFCNDNVTITGSTFIPAGDDKKNDIYLASGKTIIIPEALVSSAPVATITPASYTVGTQILYGAFVSGEYEKFALSNYGTWFIDKNGILQRDSGSDVTVSDSDNADNL